MFQPRDMHRRGPQIGPKCCVKRWHIGTIWELGERGCSAQAAAHRTMISSLVQEAPVRHDIVLAEIFFACHADGVRKGNR
jgi:hypothetical protein